MDCQQFYWYSIVFYVDNFSDKGEKRDKIIAGLHLHIKAIKGRDPLQIEGDLDVIDFNE